MFSITSAYQLSNLVDPSNPLTSSTYSGINLKATLSTSGTPPYCTVQIANANNGVGFIWSPESLIVYTSSKDFSNPLYPTWFGTNRSVILTPPYKDPRITLYVKGTAAYAAVTYDGVLTESVGSLYTGTPTTYAEGWRVSVDSTEVDTPSDVTIKNYNITADKVSSGTLAVEYHTLTAGDITNKYVIIHDNSPTQVAVNLSVSTTLLIGVDFIVVGNIIRWSGLGLDQPALLPGMTLRIMYTASSYGHPYELRVGKKLVGIGGHGA